jgi:hypothetical protein
MTPPLNDDNFKTLIRAWRNVERHSPVKLCSVRTEHHYREMTKLMNALLDKIGDHESHPLIGLLHVVTGLLSEYEKDETPIPASLKDR